MRKSFIGKSLATFTIIFTLIASSLTLTFAGNKPRNPKYVTPEGKSLEKLFDVNVRDIKQPLRWLPYKRTFPVIEKSDWGSQVWMNVPNLQSLAFGKIDAIFPTGYVGGGIDVDVATKDGSYPTDFEDGVTAMEKFGFAIPSPTYVGENAIISYGFSDVLPKGVWGTIKSAVRGTFGGSYIEPPSSAENFASLRYENVTDYVDDYAIVQWIYENWDNTCATLRFQGKFGQVLLPKSITKNAKGTVDGQDWTFQTCIVDQDLEKVVGTAEEFNVKLKATFGQYYYPLISCMVALEPKHNNSTLTNYTLRVMPYDAEDIITEGKIDISIVNDPRNDIGTYFEALHAKDVDSIGHIVRSKVVSAFGKISSWAWSMEKLTDFATIEDAGVNLNFIWSNKALMLVIAVLFTVCGIIVILKSTLAMQVGHKGPMEVAIKAIATVAVCTIAFATAISPVKVYDTYKLAMNLPIYAIEPATVKGASVSDYSSSKATEEDLYAMNYWIPYFEMWTHYNTNHGLTEQTIDSELKDVQPEQEEITLPTISEEDNAHWNVLLASSFTSGLGVDSDAYRVVDHFLAPRVTSSFKEKTIYSTVNENYNGDIQTSVGWSGLIIITLFAWQVIKLILFWAINVDFMLLPAIILFRYHEEGVVNVLKSLGISIVTYWLITVFIKNVSSFTFLAEGAFIPSLTFAVVGIGALVFTVKAFWKSPSRLKPRILAAISGPKEVR